MKRFLLSGISISLVFIPLSALAQEVDPAPSGTETQIIYNNPDTGANVGMPGADGTVNTTATPDKTVIEFDPAGTEVNNQVNDNTTIQYGD